MFKKKKNSGEKKDKKIAKAHTFCPQCRMRGKAGEQRCKNCGHRVYPIIYSEE